MEQTDTRDLKILIVDDEPEIRSLVSELIAEIGFAPLAAASKAEALALLDSHGSDIALILSDLNMPDGDGLSLREAALERFREIPFVVVSGNITRELALQGVELKIAAFLDKPVSIEKLEAVAKREAKERVELIREREALCKTFVVEAWTLLDDLEPLILALETAPADQDTINTIFRLVHTLKGSSGVLEDPTFSKFAHKLEDMLARFKGGLEAVTPDVVSVMLRGYDIFKELVRAAEARPPLKLDLNALLAAIAIQASAASAPAAEASAPHGAAAAATATKAVVRGEVRVPSVALAELMELSGEITVIRNMVNKLVRAIEKSQPGNKDVGLLAELLEEMHKINGSMQAKVIDLRKTPLANTCRALPRTLRDLSRALKKDLALIVKGDDLRVDTAINQTLSDSLIHLVRNSADHGIEMPADRVAAGKLPRGTVTLSCREERDEIIVEIQDDGRGIDASRIRRKLVDNGIMTEAEAQKLPESKILTRIFDSGFSTAAQVSEISGRGVGMDMVRASVERLKGRIDVATVLGKGTTFTLRLPVPKSVLIINSLLINVSGQTFALPQDNIVRLLRLDQAQQRQLLMRLEGGQILRMDEELLPLLPLSDVLTGRVGTKKSAEPVTDELNIVVIRAENGMFGLIVDSIIDGEEIVVKPVGPHLESLAIYAGATFLGDGTVGLILDVEGVANVAKFNTPSPVPVGQDGRAADQEAQASSDRDYLMIALDRPGTFGIPLSQVYRLEEIPAAQLQWVGEQEVFIYRDALMPIFDLMAMLHLRQIPRRERDMLPVVVARLGDRYFGFVVGAIYDVAATSREVETRLSDRPGLTGSVLIGATTASIIDLIEVLRQHGIAVPVAPVAPAEAAPAQREATETLRRDLQQHTTPAELQAVSGDSGGAQPPAPPPTKVASEAPTWGLFD